MGGRDANREVPQKGRGGTKMRGAAYRVPVPHRIGGDGASDRRGCLRRPSSSRLKEDLRAQ